MLNMSWTSILFHAIHSVHHNYLNSLELPLHAVQPDSMLSRLETGWNQLEILPNLMPGQAGQCGQAGEHGG
jgi:hypothetical protein